MIGDDMTEIRALTVFDSIPVACILQIITDNTCDPHLRVGEFAVIDPSDREPQQGELYLVGNKNIYDELRCKIYQVRSKVLRDERSREWQAWWYGPLIPEALPAKGHATAEAAMLKPLRFVLSEGPMLLTGIRQKIVGRVIGIFEAAQ
jgi:hypothetical protein